MTVAISQAKIMYEGNGVTTQWDIPFPFLNKADLQVHLVSPSGDQVLLGSDFSVDMDLKAVIYPLPGGDTPPLADGKKLLILRRTPLSQQADFSAQHDFDPFVLEEGYDKAMMIAQEQAEELARAVKFPAACANKETDAEAYLIELQRALADAQTAGSTARKTLADAEQAAQTARQASQNAEEAVSTLQGYVDEADAAKTAAQGAQSAAQTAQSSAETARAQAQASQSAAQTARSGAETALTQAQSARDAARSAQSGAETARDAALNSQSAAAQSQTSAASSAQLAKDWANKTGAPVSGGEYSAKKYAQDAAASARLSLGHAMGEVFYSQSSCASDNPGALPLWTGEYYPNASVLYPDFYAWVKARGVLCTSKSDYDLRLGTYGECPFYVVDEVSGSLRLPKLVNYIKNADASGLTQSKAGLPNITGSAEEVLAWNNTAAGALTKNGNNGSMGGGNQAGYYTLGFDASKSSSVYGAANTVTPAHTTLYPWVYAFNAAVPASSAQAAEFAGSLSGKANADLNNIPANYDYVVSKSVSGANWYRVYKSGWTEQGGVVSLDSVQYASKTVSLLKAMSNNSYTLLVGGRNDTNNGNYTFSAGSLKTATSFSIWQERSTGGNHTNSASWYVCGQGA